MPSAYSLPDDYSVDSACASPLNKKTYHKTFCYSPSRCKWQVILVLLSLLILPGKAMPMQPFRIGTGGSTGVYYPIGKLIASGITLESQNNNPILNNVIGVAQNSGGSIDNVQGLLSGGIEAALVQADVAAFAYKDLLTSEKSKKNKSIRAIASLYSEKFQIVVRKDAKIQTFNDLKGKSISVDELGSGTLSVMRIILEAHKMTEKDLLPLYLKPVFTHDKLQSGQVQGFVMMAGAPMDAVTQLLDTGITLVPIDQAVTTQINREYPYLYPGKIDANTYSGIDEIPTLEVFALLVVSDQMPNEMAFSITKTLFNKETLKLFKNGHPQSHSITLDTALNGISIPLHPGAESYYRENNLLDSH